MKIHKKVYGIAKLYYDIEDYNAAITALNNVITDYPTIDNQSEIQFLILDANYKLAINSVSSKKIERLNNTIASYRYFAKNFPEDNRLKEANNIYEKSIKQLEKFQQ